MLMAAARLNLPSVFLYGGSILPGRWKDQALDVVSVFEAIGACAAGTITEDELTEIERGLDRVDARMGEHGFEFDPADEDIHLALERFLTGMLGEVGAKIHAGRSRNDLVVTDFRLWIKETIPAIARGVYELQSVLLARAKEHKDVLAPGYTHLQRAQPVLLAHHLLAHGFALARDFDRLAAAYRRADVSCLGAAAFAGTTLPLDPVATAEELGFESVFDNSADAVSSRDFALELLAALAILAVQLSRIAEEVVLWTTTEFGFATLDDAFATGSSIMPQKKNPDVAELVRAKASRVTADLVHLLGVVKALPLAYNRDLQEDKEPVFDAADSVLRALSALAGALSTMTFEVERLAAAAGGGSAGATDLAEGLVMEGVPFRSAHEAVGKLVGAALATGKPLEEVGEPELRAAHPALRPEMLERLDPRRSVGARTSHGGTAPERVAEQIDRLESLLEKQLEWLQHKGAG
jgi:argininosuccinate lyase